MEAYSLRTDPSYQRRKVLRRDRGVCAICGRDCLELARQLRPLRRVPLYILDSLCRSQEPGWWPKKRTPWGPDYPTREEVERALDRYLQAGLGPAPGGSFPHLLRDTFWDMDHAIPLSEGGENGLANLRTLCIPCHARESAEGARRRAKARRMRSC